MRISIHCESNEGMDLMLQKSLSEKLIEEALMTPIIEDGTGWAFHPYVMDIANLETNYPGW